MRHRAFGCKHQHIYACAFTAFGYWCACAHEQSGKVRVQEGRRPESFFSRSPDFVRTLDDGDKTGITVFSSKEQGLSEKRPHSRNIASEEPSEEVENELEEEVEDIDPVAFTIATLLVAFLFINMVILHCIHYPDPNIRVYVYGMMNTTISVFLAVVFNEAVYSFIVEQILAAPFPRGFSIEVGYRVRVLVGLFQLVAFYFLLNWIAYKFRNSRGKGYMYSTKVIGGHITAFAGITFFGCMQETHAIRHHMGLSVVLLFGAVIAMAIIRRVFHHVRLWLNSLSKKTYQSLDSPAQMDTSSAAQELDWGEELSEVEDDSMGLILSFLVRQIALFSICHRMLPIRGDPSFLPSASQIANLALWSLAFMVLMLITATVRHHLRKINFLDKLSWGKHLSETWECTCAMTMSLCLCRVGEWSMRNLVREPAMCLVASAAATTTIVLVAIVVLDKVADKLTPEKRVSAQVRKSFESELQKTSVSEMAWAGTNVSSKHVLQMQEHSLRKIIEALGLAVGLSWERAFHAAEETLIDGIPVAHAHVVVSKALFATILLMVVFPAWLWYIIPKARLTEEDHQTIMDLSSNANERDKVG